MPEQRPFLERIMFGRQHGPRAEREEKVLQYIIHRVDEDADLHDVLQEPYVRRNCSQGMTDGENHRDLLTRLSTALAMTEAAYLEARRRRDL